MIIERNGRVGGRFGRAGGRKAWLDESIGPVDRAGRSGRVGWPDLFVGRHIRQDVHRGRIFTEASS